MDAKPRVVDPARAFDEDFEPQMEWAHEEECDNLILPLPGFRKEQIRVQLTSNRTLRISGERPIGDQKYQRFEKEISVPSNTETTQITAVFEKGNLSVRLPKVISQHKPKTEPQYQDALDQQATPELSKASHVDKRSYDHHEKTSVQENVLDHANKDTQKAPKKDNQEESSRRDGKSSMVADDAANKLPRVPAEGYKQVVGGITWDVKKPKTLMNLVVAALLVLVLVLSVKIAMKPSGQSKTTHSAV